MKILHACYLEIFLLEESGMQISVPQMRSESYTWILSLIVMFGMKQKGRSPQLQGINNYVQTLCFVCQPQPLNDHCCDRTGPGGSYCDCKTSFSSKHQETWKNKGLLLTSPGNCTTHLRPHSEVIGGLEERENERESDTSRYEG